MLCFFSPTVNLWIQDLRGSFCCSLIDEVFISACNMNYLYKTNEHIFLIKLWCRDQSAVQPASMCEYRTNIYTVLLNMDRQLRSFKTITLHWLFHCCLFIMYETTQYCLEILAHHLLGVRYRWFSTEQVLWFTQGNEYLNNTKECRAILKLLAEKI